MTDDIKYRLRTTSKMTNKYYEYGRIKSHLDELQQNRQMHSLNFRC